MNTRPLARPPRRHDLLARILDDRSLVQAVQALPAGDKPWLAVSQLDALGEVLALDDLAGLRRLLSQCPTLPSSDPRERAPLRFIASRRDVATAASFLEGVASTDRHRLER